MRYIPTRLRKVLAMRIRPDIASRTVPGFPWSYDAYLRWKEYRDAKCEMLEIG